MKLEPGTHEINIGLLRPGPTQRIADESVVPDLAENIRQNGLRSALVVMHDDQAKCEGTYLVIDGLHRYLAAEMVGLKTVRCVVIPFNTCYFNFTPEEI